MRRQRRAFRDCNSPKAMCFAFFFFFFPFHFFPFFLDDELSTPHGVKGQRRLEESALYFGHGAGYELVSLRIDSGHAPSVGGGPRIGRVPWLQIRDWVMRCG